MDTSQVGKSHMQERLGKLGKWSTRACRLRVTREEAWAENSGEWRFARGEAGQRVTASELPVVGPLASMQQVDEKGRKRKRKRKRNRVGAEKKALEIRAIGR